MQSQITCKDKKYSYVLYEETCGPEFNNDFDFPINFLNFHIHDK